MIICIRIDNSFSKTYPSFLTVMEGFSKIIPSFFTIKEGSTSLINPLSCPKRKDVTALRCSEPLRYKVGGPSKLFAMLCGMGSQGGGGVHFQRPPFIQNKPLLEIREHKQVVFNV